MKILNLYAGIGGNRKLWGDEHEITAVEINPDIAAIYQDFYPNDTVIVGDAHQYLLDHFREFDFIWSSPPCPTHSRFNLLNYSQDKKHKYPDMSLYQEVILLKHWFKGKFCVENVITYYKPLIPPIESASHYYWTNFYFKPLPNINRGIRGSSDNFNYRCELLGIDVSKFNIKSDLKRKVINNCVEPKEAKHIFDSAFNTFDEEIKLFEDLT